MHYNKPPLTLADQVQQLKARGMAFADETEAESALAKLNYYRLTAYWYPFYEDTRNHRFRPGTRFEDVLRHYEFDRQLRLLALDAIGRFEIALRTQFAYQLAHRHGPWAYEDPELFVDTAKHTGRLASLDRELKRSQETFIRHYKKTYTSPQRPPIWIACEVMSLGLLSGLFDSLNRRADRQAIAEIFNMDELVVRSLAHHLTVIRNTCAHYGRLWNRRFPITTKLPRHADERLRDSLAPDAPKKLYNSLVLLVYCIGQISSDHSNWRRQLLTLLDGYPDIDVSAMGFPDDWRLRALWRVDKTAL